MENFTPSSATRAMGYGYEELTAVNTRLIYASITGFGTDSKKPGYDLVASAVGGLMSITGPEVCSPTEVEDQMCARARVGCKDYENSNESFCIALLQVFKPLLFNSCCICFGGKPKNDVVTICGQFLRTCCFCGV